MNMFKIENNPRDAGCKLNVFETLIYALCPGGYSQVTFNVRFVSAKGGFFIHFIHFRESSSSVL